MATAKCNASCQPEVDSDRLPAFVLGPVSDDPAHDPLLDHFHVLLSDLGLDDQPDLAGLILGRLLALQGSFPNFDYPTAAAVLRAVARSIHQWRADWTEQGDCPLCDRLA